MVKFPSFEEQWPIKVRLANPHTHYTDAFAWLWTYIIRNELDHKTVFTTFGNHYVGFAKEYREIAFEFKLRFG